MSKFLSIVENNLPSEQASIKSNMVDKLVELLNTVSQIEVESLHRPKELKIKIGNNHIVLEVKSVYTSDIKSEDAEDPALAAANTVDRNVDMLAAKKDPIALPAQTDRIKTVRGAVGVYKDLTKQLATASRIAKQSSNIQPKAY